MAADTVKSASVINLDGNTYGQVTANTAGVGGQENVKSVSDYVTTTVLGLQNTGSTYKVLRVQTNIKLKELILTADAALDTSTGLALDVGAYYSDAYSAGGINDGTPAALSGTSVGGAVNQFYAAGAGAQSSAKGPTSVLSALAVAKRQLPLWDALGLTADPGGFFDIVVAVHTAATTGGATNFSLRAEYANG